MQMNFLRNEVKSGTPAALEVNCFAAAMLNILELPTSHELSLHSKLNLDANGDHIYRKRVNKALLETFSEFVPMRWRRTKKGDRRTSFAHSCTPFHSKSLRDVFSNFHETLTVWPLSRKPKKLPAQLREAAEAARPRPSRIGRVAEPKNSAKRSKGGAGAARPWFSPIRSGYGDKNSMARAKRCVNRKAHVHSMFD
jgi:hypothetical protein